ncbi:helix-turn-helix transcriptional regulator [Haladaptatus sp. NG-WS-4]
MRRLLAVGLVAMLLVGSFPAFGTTQSNGPTNPQTIATSQEFDDVEFQIVVYENYSARWTFRYEKTLNNQSEREEFNQFAKEFNNGETELYRDFRTNAGQLTSTANNQTERGMVAENFSKRAYVGGGGLNQDAKRGVVEMSFRWTSFAYSDDGHYAIGDVFKGGLFLSENQTLVIEPADGMKFKSAQPVNGRHMTGDTLAESETVSWSGPREFNDQRPMVRFTAPPNNGSPTTTAPPGGNENPPGDGDESPSDSPMMLFVAAVVVLIGLAAVFAWRQGSFGSLSSPPSTPSGGGDGGAASTEPSGGTAEPAVSDEELLTDEARVKKLLRENGGRMKQVNIVDETGWSKSKVSMLLSEMEDEGDISKLRVGRENIISLDGHEPDAAGSPLDRE